MAGGARGPSHAWGGGGLPELAHACMHTPPHTHTLAISVQAMEADGVLLALRDAMQPPEGVLSADQWGVLERGGEVLRGWRCHIGMLRGKVSAS